MAKQPPENPPNFKVGDKIRANLHRGQIDDVIIKAIVETDSGMRLQVDVVGLDVTALIDLSQVWSANH